MNFFLSKYIKEECSDAQQLASEWVGPVTGLLSHRLAIDSLLWYLLQTHPNKLKFGSSASCAVGSSMYFFITNISLYNKKKKYKRTTQPDQKANPIK